MNIRTAGDMVILSGGAQVNNIFWQVGGGTSVVIGTRAYSVGIVLAENVVTVNTGVTVIYWLLA